jgi:hypothetical protein
MGRSRISKWILRLSLGTIAILLGLSLASSILARLWQSTPEPPSSILFENDVA